MIETRIDAHVSRDVRTEALTWLEFPVYGPKTFFDPIVETFSLTEIRTLLSTYRETRAETYAVTDASTIIFRGHEIRAEAYSLTEVRADQAQTAGLVQHSTDILSELIRLSGNPPNPLTAKQAAESIYEEEPMPGNSVTQSNVTVTTTATRLDVTPLTGRIRVRVTNMGDSVIYIAATQNFCVVNQCDRVEPLGGSWEQVWTESVQVWAVALSGTNPAILTQTAVV